MSSALDDVEGSWSGEFPLGALFILKDPPVLTTKSLPPIFLRSPPPRFPRVAPLHVALSTLIHEMIQVVKHLLGHANTEVVAPASDHWIDLIDQRHCGRTHVLAPDAFEFPLHVFDGVRARFDQQLVATARALGRRIMADIGPTGGNVRPDLIRGQCVAVLLCGTGDVTSERPCMPSL
jgi:hypothetical protein